MIAPGAELKIYIATRLVDFRCGHDGACFEGAGDAWSRPVQRCGLRVPVETGGPDQDSGLGSNGPGVSSQTPRGLQVRMANDCGRRDADIAGDVRGVVRGPGLEVGPPGGSAASTGRWITAAE
jgi:hypothetical protein